MQFANYFEPSLTTLAVSMVFPFLYFAYHKKYWYDLKKQKLGDFLLFILAVVGIVLVIVKATQLRQGSFGSSPDALFICLLHLGPLLQTLVLIYFKNPVREYMSRYAPPANSQSDVQATSTVKLKPGNKEIKHITWDDLIINPEIRTEILSVIELLRDPKISAKYGVKVPKGIILSGPPGNGKTTVAKVIANTAGLNFFSLSSDQVISKWVGESEKNLTHLFDAALRHRPSVLFIDEIDTIGRKRTGGGDGSQWSENLLNHFLQLIDGIYEAKGVYIIGATNRPDLIDPALKRSGRLNREIEIPSPDFEARAKLFMLYLRKLNIAHDVDINSLAVSTEGMSAADIESICNQAGINSFKRESTSGNREYLVSFIDLEQALVNFINQKNADSRPI